MSNELAELLAKTKHIEFSATEKEAQRRSFAFGNTQMENSRITREMVDEQAELLKLPTK